MSDRFSIKPIEPADPVQFLKLWYACWNSFFSILRKGSSMQCNRIPYARKDLCTDFSCPCLGLKMHGAPNPSTALVRSSAVEKWRCPLFLCLPQKKILKI